jgi:hypothetical protein
MTNEELYSKLNTLNRDELESYETAAISTKKFIDVSAVSTLLVILMFTNLFTIVSGGLLVYLMGHMSVNVTNTLAYIRARLSKMPVSDK